MARHSFIQMSKLSNVKGRISYISDPKRQEYLYATFSTREDMTFWNDLAKECQEEFKRFGTEGKCIEARELIIALPEEYTKFDPNQVLREFTEQFKKRYDVECVSALHHNKTKKNYHIHLIFSERRLLPEPEVKIATRSVFYDELGKRVRTKKEIPGEDGQIREGCIVIKKGEAYEKHLFTAKDEVFKNELFLDEAKQFYTALINRHIHDPERRLKVFDPNSVYLPTKKIGKNNPKEAEIEADNAARQDWNRTADMALVSGIEESKIIEIRNEHVYDEATRSVQKHGWLPGLFRGIIQKAKEILQVLIRETEIPPKPTLSVDMAEYRTMQKLMVKVQDEARAIKQLMHGELPKLEKQLAETTGLFRGKERKALQEKISGVQQEIDRRIIVRRKHFGVSVDVHSRALCLLQKLFQILQVMTGNQNAGVVPDADIDLCDFRISVCAGIGGIEKRHAVHAELPGLQRQRHQIVNCEAIVQSLCQCALKESVDFFVVLHQGVGVLGVCRKPLETVGNHLAQGTDVFILRRENADRVGIRFCVELTLASVPKRRFRQGVQVSQLRAQVFLDFERFLDSRNDCVAIEVRVGNRSKQVDGHEMVDVLSDLFSFLPEFSGHAGKPLRHIDQQIEHGRQFGSLSAYADLCAAGAPRRLLTLIAEHFTFFHWFLLLSFLPFT